MKAALFEMSGWMGREKHIFCGENAVEILQKLEDIQDLACLARMGRKYENGDGLKQIDKLDEIVKKYYTKTITMQDILDFDISLQTGIMKCLQIAESDEEIQTLVINNPNASKR